MSVWWTGALRVLFDVLYNDERVCVVDRCSEGVCLCGGQVL